MKKILLVIVLITIALSFNIIEEVTKPYQVDIAGSILNQTQQPFEVLHSLMKTVKNLNK